MFNLPVIVGFGGINSAGRSSGNQSLMRALAGFDRLSDNVALSNKDMEYLLESLSSLTNIETNKDLLFKNSLIRKNSDNNTTASNLDITLCHDSDNCYFDITTKNLPSPIDQEWRIQKLDKTKSRVYLSKNKELNILFKQEKKLDVNIAGYLPTNFLYNKNWEYPDRNKHPRGLRMAIYAINDALSWSGLDWDSLTQNINPDLIGVYGSSSLGQIDSQSFNGLLNAHIEGKNITARQLPLSYPQMTADFISAYVLGNIGSNQGAVGACATFLYNLNSAVKDIKHGYKKLAIVGCSDTLLLPSVVKAFQTINALAEDDKIEKIFNSKDPEILRLAASPFTENVGFVMGESAQFFILMSDDLAHQTGAQIFGSLPCVHLNADGYKKSITAPGIGNNISIIKAANDIKLLLGEKALQNRSYVHSHATSTKQNRKTESFLINETAKYFGIQSWPISAIKSYVGHSQATASADQIMFACSSWDFGFIPKVVSYGQIHEDVSNSNLNILNSNLNIKEQKMDAALINSKGFGGNNATAVMISPEKTIEMLNKRHGKLNKNNIEKLKLKSNDYDANARKGNISIRYRYDYSTLRQEDISLSENSINVDGFALIPLKEASDFNDMID